MRDRRAVRDTGLLRRFVVARGLSFGSTTCCGMGSRKCLSFVLFDSQVLLQFVIEHT